MRKQCVCGGPNGDEGTRKEKRKKAGMGWSQSLTARMCGTSPLIHLRFSAELAALVRANFAEMHPSHDSDVCHDMWSTIISGQTAASAQQSHLASEHDGAAPNGRAAQYCRVR
jgi:hypothetical protein